MKYRGSYDLPLWISRDLQLGVIDRLDWDTGQIVTGGYDHVTLVYLDGSTRVILLAKPSDYASLYYDSTEDPNDRWEWEFSTELLGWFRGERSRIHGVVASKRNVKSGALVSIFSALASIDFSSHRGVVMNPGV